MSSFKRIGVHVKKFYITLQTYNGTDLTNSQVGEVILDLEQKINTMVLDSRNKEVLASARIHIDVD